MIKIEDLKRAIQDIKDDKDWVNDSHSNAEHMGLCQGLDRLLRHFKEVSKEKYTSVNELNNILKEEIVKILDERVDGFGGGEPFRTNQISPFLVPLVFFSFSLARSLTLMLCSGMSLVRACCVRGQRETE